MSLHRNPRDWNSLRTIKPLALVILVALSPAAAAAELVIKVSPRASEQLAAFYEARGFPAPAVKLISGHCFIGVTVKNRTDKVVWLEPGRWRIVGADKSHKGIRPLDNDYWQRRWQEIGLSPAKQATFRWTQLPKSRDLQPQEPVGGNIAIPATTGPLALELRFATGQGRTGPEIRRRVGGLRCR